MPFRLIALLVVLQGTMPAADKKPPNLARMSQAELCRYFTDDASIFHKDEGVYESNALVNCAEHRLSLDYVFKQEVALTASDENSLKNQFDEMSCGSAVQAVKKVGWSFLFSVVFPSGKHIDYPATCETRGQALPAPGPGHEMSFPTTSQGLAAELVAILSPPDAMRENMLRSATISIDQGLAQDPNLPAAELNYPGLMAAMKAAGLASVTPIIGDAYRDLAVRHRDLLVQSFSAPELRELVTFYGSPVARQGAAEALAAARNALVPSVKRKMQEKAGSGKFAGNDIENITMPAGPAKVSKSVEEAYLKFSSTPVAYKQAVSFTAAYEKLMAQWLNDYASRIQSIIKEAMTDEAKSFIERNEGAAAKNIQP